MSASLLAMGCDGASVALDGGPRSDARGVDARGVDAYVECSAGGSVVAGRCVCSPGYTGASCTECQPGYEREGDTCVPLPTEWMPYTEDENYDRENAIVTGFPAVISYAEAGAYPEHVGILRNGDIPVGSCEMIEDALLGVAPAMRCTWGATYEDSADPAIGGDPHGYGQTYLGPGGASIDPALGEVTAISIAFVWQFGEGWLDAMAYRDDHRFETPWDGEYADIEIGGAGGKPLITHRERCEYWYDVSEDLGTSASFSGALEAPDGMFADSLEIVLDDGAFVYGDDGGALRLGVGGPVVGSIEQNGSYELTLAEASSARAYYRTMRPDAEGAPRFQSGGAWRRPLASESCRERPMMIANAIHWTSETEDDALPAMTPTAADDIACFCHDWDGTRCNEGQDSERRRLHFRIGSPSQDDPEAGVFHVGVAEPIYIEMVVDTVNGPMGPEGELDLDLYVTTPDGRFNDTRVSASWFCDTPQNGAIRNNDHPHRGGGIVRFGEPFWALPLTTVPPNAWHQVGQMRVVGATDGAPVARQGPPLGFVRAD
jgi:hypothetical protein